MTLGCKKSKLNKNIKLTQVEYCDDIEPSKNTWRADSLPEKKPTEMWCFPSNQLITNTSCTKQRDNT